MFMFCYDLLARQLTTSFSDLIVCCISYWKDLLFDCPNISISFGKRIHLSISFRSNSSLLQYLTIFVILSLEALTNTTYNGIGVTEFWPVLRHIFHKKFRIFFIFRGNQKIFSHLFIVRQTQISITAWSEWISYNIWWRKQFLRCY